MSTQISMNYNKNNILENEEKDNYKNSNIISKNNNNNSNNNSSSINSNINNSSKLFYQYPICLYTEKDPIDDYKLRIIKARNKGSDTFLKNYLKYNFSPKNDTKNESIEKMQEKLLENNKSNLFITENKNKINKSSQSIKSSINSINNGHGKKTPANSIRVLHRSQSDILNPFSRKAINNYRKAYLKEMEKRGNLYNKRKMAYLQRIALYNFSSMNVFDDHFVNGSIPSGKSDESYILETKKRKKLPGIKEYLRYRLKSMKENDMNTPENFREKSKKFEKNNLPEIIDIKNSGRFKFHVFHDRYGFIKEMDKRDNRVLKMTKDKIRDLKVMAKINKIKDPELIETFKRALYW
jgi:hypothetical protein